MKVKKEKRPRRKSSNSIATSHLNSSTVNKPQDNFRGVMCNRLAMEILGKTDMQIVRYLIVVLLFAAGSAGQSAVPPFDELSSHYSYDRQPHMVPRESGVEKRDGIMVIEMSYPGSRGRVPAYLLLPPGKGPFPAILWGHWLKKKSPLNNRDEFLEE